MPRPKDQFRRSCLVCIATNPRYLPPNPHYAKGLCEKHYRQEQRKKPKCKAAGCTTRLVPGYSREGYCRMHEPLLLVEPIRTPEAMRRTLDKFVRQITPTRDGLDGLFGCWPWTGRINKVDVSPTGELRPGYGVISIDNHEWLAHRYSYGLFMGGHGNRLTLDHVCRNTLCVRPDHMMPMTSRRNSELEHRRASEQPEAVIQDLFSIKQMSVETMLRAMLQGLPIGRTTPGGGPFAYGLDGQAFEHVAGPVDYPPVTQLIRRK